MQNAHTHTHTRTITLSHYTHRRSIYERNLYALPTGAARSTAAPHTAGRGEGSTVRRPSAARLRWGAGGCGCVCARLMCVSGSSIGGEVPEGAD